MACCNSIDEYFAEKHAERDVQRYEARGPDNTTRHLLRAVRSHAPHAGILMDIGGGIGVLSRELVPDDVSRVVHVDASQAYMYRAREAAERERTEDRIRFVENDFTRVAHELESADVVTLDRVICCYPNAHSLVRLAAGKALRLIALSYPRTHVFSRIAFSLDNLKRRIRRDPFRAFVHPRSVVENAVQGAGFELVSEQHTLMWRIVAFQRTSGSHHP